MYWAKRNAKEVLNVQALIPEQVHLKNLQYMGSTTIQQGWGVVENATTGHAELADHTDGFVYLTWAPSNWMTAQDSQRAPSIFNVGNVPIPAGGIAVFMGSNEEYDILTSEVDTTTHSTPAAGYWVCISNATAGLLEFVPNGSITGRISFGKVTKVEGDRTYFTFESKGYTHP